jgi:predicted NBD/HSP70 family sugar kinase
MALTYTWKITGLKKTNVPSANLTDVVVGTRWDVTGTDEDGNSGTFHGATPFKASEVDPDNFIDWNNLTEEVVLGWIKGIVVGGYASHVHEVIMKQINEKKNPVLDADYLPWDPTTPVSANAMAIAAATGAAAAAAAPAQEVSLEDL